ncbi:pantetheine-phosphate adenylyltransferase [Helcococcus ovis]|uniref:Phosphopantetheine adenylyltransferase n=1 Tax=Helcococcus ovis TaxID=72026 RepID=A0A4R9C3X4_9FIRM|nr:pantetheine-phosphate adenylyltransferase [Helcococcus ovis]TFF64895.1 pantetheine-phosphate adenylyltransferase [Helcococcus ovis]TFF67172.1 pantetheine-phosphate adenylyltransferase [Helcococcus ovis]TFF67366.1 pantetheine-phosphate adenylyltransferase [Helcococcus ovis]WNZ01887.1 pantetheine-phosphate adenylyltransferase [Helcococcus ovis]
MKVVYPGSFDPVTNGHIDIIKRAAGLFEEVVVCVLVNSKKNYLFNMEERIEMLEELLYDYDNVKVCMYSGLLIDFVEKNKIDSIIRGIRAISDYESELQFAQMNKFYSRTNVETIFMVAEPEMSYLSSSIVKEIASFNGDVSRLVPKNVEIKIKQKFK